MIAASAEHTATVTEDGDLYGWGWGRYENLGLGDRNDRLLPEKVSSGGLYADYTEELLDEKEYLQLNREYSQRIEKLKIQADEYITKLSTNGLPPTSVSRTTR